MKRFIVPAIVVGNVIVSVFLRGAFVKTVD
jgi:hypothetical protein